jgi:hypothetical protein
MNIRKLFITKHLFGIRRHFAGRFSDICHKRGEWKYRARESRAGRGGTLSLKAVALVAAVLNVETFAGYWTAVT